jgi:hypothetical protein
MFPMGLADGRLIGFESQLGDGGADAGLGGGAYPVLVSLPVKHKRDSGCRGTSGLGDVKDGGRQAHAKAY